MIGVWPDLDELQLRLDETEALANRRTELLRNRVRRGETSERLVTLLVNDIALKNLEARADSYRVDIARMLQHSLDDIVKGPDAGWRWVCGCGAKATASAPTPLRVSRAHGEHVQREVWGA